MGKPRAGIVKPCEHISQYDMKTATPSYLTPLTINTRTTSGTPASCHGGLENISTHLYMQLCEYENVSNEVFDTGYYLIVCP